MTQFNYQATEDFRSLILSICTSPSAYGDKNQVQAQLADLLSAGADPNAPSVQGRSVVLDDLTLFPSLAISLLDHGARLSSSGLNALRDNFNTLPPITHNLFQSFHPLHQENAERMRRLAALQPDLNWYEAFHVKGGPWAVALERSVKGFNDVLENARKKAGIALHMPSNIEDRVSALLELAEQTNSHIWLEGKDRLTLLDQLMGADISPNHHLPLSKMSLFARYMDRSSMLARALLEKGAVLTQHDMDDFLDFLSDTPTNFHIYELVPDVLDKMDQWAHLKQKNGHGSMLDYFLEIAPEEYVSWQADKIDKETPIVSHSARSRRL